MNLLQIFFVISGAIITILAIDVAKRRKFNALHFLVFLGVGGGLLVATFFPQVLRFIGDIFGIPRGADALVYASIVFLIYFSLLLLNKIESGSSDFTLLVREIALQNAPKKKLHGKEVFVIPSYNEGKVIASTVQHIVDAGYKHIVVVNDGSSDATLEVLEPYMKHATVLSHYKNRGQGASLETGFEYVRRYGEVEYVVTFDADGQHDINDLKEFEKYLDHHHGVDVLLGSRFIGKKSTGMPLAKRVVLKLGIIFTFLLSHIHLSDTHNGYRVITAKALKKIRLTIDGMGHASEILDIIASQKLTYKEVPVNIQYTEYSMKKGQRIGNAFNIATRMIWNKFFK